VFNGNDLQWRIMNKDRNTLQVTQKAFAAVEKIATRTGLPKKIIVERVFGWLDGESDVIQSAVLGQLPQSVAPDVARLVLERMTNEQLKAKKTA
jgi:hypothetical protein